MKLLISVCMIVRNEEKVLKRCLESIRGIADEIIIADTGSVDRTKDIALEYADIVLDYKWEDDFSKARNFAASHASGEWILVIDADEFVDRDSFAAFKESLKNNPPNYNILAVQIVNFVGVNGEFTSLNYHERLYKNNGLIEYYRSIHELLKHKGALELRGLSDFQIYHSGYMESVVKEKEKSKRNLNLLKNKKDKEPIDYYHMGNVYSQLGELDKAINFYRKSFQLKGSSNAEWVKKLLVRLVNTLHEAKRNKEALEIVEKCEDIYNNLVDFKFIKGKIYYDTGDFESAKKVFEEILVKNKDLVADSSQDYLEYLPCIYLGELYEEEQQLHLAVECFTRALSINNGDDNVWMRLIHLLAKHSTLEELSMFLNNNFLNKRNLKPIRATKILLSVPDINVQKLTRNFLVESELLTEEQEALRIKNLYLDGNKNKVVEILNDKSSNQIYSLLAKGIFSIVDFIIITIETQNQGYQKILHDMKSDANINNLLSILFNKKNKRLIKLEENLFISLLQQANVLGWEKVIDHLNSKVKYLSIDAKVKIKKIERTITQNSNSCHFSFEKNPKEIGELKKQIESLLSKHHYNSALTIIDESLTIVPTDVDLYSIKAVILISQKKFDKAKEVLEKGLEINSNHVDCLYNLAFIYEQKNQLGFAIELYEKILYLTDEEDLILEIKERIFKNQELLRQIELKKRFNNSKYAKKQDLIVKNGKSNSNLHAVYVLTHVGICGGVKIILEQANRLTELCLKVSLVCHYPMPTWYPVEANYIEVPFEVEIATGIPDCDVIVATYWDHIQACIDTEIAPVVYFEQGDFHLFDYENMDENLKRFIYQQYQLPKFIFTVTNQTAKKIKRIYNREVKVIHNAIDTSVFNNVRNSSDNGDKPYILMIGSANIKFKGLDYIIEAYKKVKRIQKNIKLYWITPIDPPKEYASAIDKYFVNPSQNKIAELYSGASVFVSASSYESFSLPVLEAMACSCPVVTTGNEGVLEYAEDNFNVLITKIGDPQDISDKILKVLNNHELKNKLITNGLATVENFDWDNIITQLLKHYREIARYEVNKTETVSEIQTGGSNMHGVYIGDNKMLIKTVWGGKLITSNKDMSLMPDLVANGLIEGPLTKFFMNNVKEGDIVVDVGANIGYYTILTGFKVGNSGKVIAFEGNDSTFSFLMDNVSINYLVDRVKLFNKAVYSQNQELSIYTTERFSGNASIHQPDQEYYDYFLVDKGMEEKRVQAIALDTFFDNNEVIDYIKVDIEGGEYHCLLGMQDMIKTKRVKTVIFELNKLRSREDSEKLYTLLTNFQNNYGVRYGVVNNEGQVNEFPLEQIFKYDFIPSVIMKVM